MRFVWLLFPVAFSACSGPQSFEGGDGPPVYSMFPFDGQRTWTYVSTDAALTYKIVSTCDGISEPHGDQNIYTEHYTVDCVGNDPTCVTGTELFALRWSSDNVNGTYVHAFGVDDGSFVDFAPPVQITTDNMNRDDVLTTHTGGATWTSTMEGLGACPLRMSASFDDCGQFTVTTDAGDGYPLAGTWWAAVGPGVTAFQLTTDSGQWQLSNYTCEDTAQAACGEPW